MHQNTTKKVLLFVSVLLLFLLAMVLIVAFISKSTQNSTAMNVNNNQGNTTQDVASGEPYVDKFITAVPFNLSQIASISKFRSCSGHDYSAANVDGQQETNRSMKHYINPLDALIGTENTIEIFAPFDGTVAAITADSENSSVPVGVQVWLTPVASPTWSLNFYHIVPIVKAGDVVKAGQLIGYANLTHTTVIDFDVALEAWVQQANAPLGPTNLGNLTLALQREPNYLHLLHTGQLDSIFLHMNADVLAQFAAKGISPQNIIVSKDMRDTSPCPQPSTTGYYESNPNDFVMLQ